LGCTANSAITNKEANSYSALKEFVINKLGKESSAFSDYEATIIKDGSIEYKAIFNGANYRSLRRPKENIQGYCIQKGGTFRMVDTFSSLKKRHRKLLTDTGGIGYKPVVIQAANDGNFGSSICDLGNSKWNISIEPASTYIDYSANKGMGSITRTGTLKLNIIVIEVK